MSVQLGCSVSFHRMELWTASGFDWVHFEFYNNIWEWKIIEGGGNREERREPESKEGEGDSGETGNEKVVRLEEDYWVEEPKKSGKEATERASSRGRWTEKCPTEEQSQTDFFLLEQIGPKTAQRSNFSAFQCTL